MEFRLDMGRLQLWQIWRSHGWGKDDLRLVVDFLKREIQNQRRWRSALYFTNLIANTDRFEEFLADAKARGRIPVIKANRAEALKASGRRAPEEAEKMRAEARPIKNVFGDFVKWSQQFRAQR